MRPAPLASCALDTLSRAGAGAAENHRGGLAPSCAGAMTTACAWSTHGGLDRARRMAPTLGQRTCILSLERMRAIEKHRSGKSATMTVRAGTSPSRPSRRRPTNSRHMFFPARSRLPRVVPDRRQCRDQCRRQPGDPVRHDARTRAGARGGIGRRDGRDVLNKLIKNNAGYDLRQVFIGSEGTLGMITRLVLRLREKPRSQQCRPSLRCRRFQALAKSASPACRPRARADRCRRSR